MKDFTGNNPCFSLCGLNCRLCSMHLSGNCGGCGFGNQSCPIARCSLEHGRPEYCFQCPEYSCEKYANIDEFDSFITHRNQIPDLEKMQRIGEEAYNAEQIEKRQILDRLLSEYNDGLKKTLFCLAVNPFVIGGSQIGFRGWRSGNDDEGKGKTDGEASEGKK